MALLFASLCAWINPRVHYFRRGGTREFAVGGLISAACLAFWASCSTASHDAEEIAAVDFFDVVGGVAFFEQCAGEGGEFVVGVEAFGDAAYSVEVGADAYVVDAADLDGVVDLGDYVGEGGGWDTWRWLKSASFSMAAARAAGSSIFCASMYRSRMASMRAWRRRSSAGRDRRSRS